MKIRKELWFGFSLMAIIIGAIIIFTPWGHLSNGHLGLIMLALIVVAIMLGYPTAFTLMGLGVFFAWLAYRSANPQIAMQQTLDLMVQRSYGVMSNDVLIAVPLFVFMGYLVERAALIDRLFKSLHLATARVPGSLAVATVITCAIFATAFCSVVVPNIMPVIEVSKARWIGCIRLCQVLWLVCTPRRSSCSLPL